MEKTSEGQEIWDRLQGDDKYPLDPRNLHSHAMRTGEALNYANAQSFTDEQERKVITVPSSSAPNCWRSGANPHIVPRFLFSRLSRTLESQKTRSVKETLHNLIIDKFLVATGLLALESSRES